MFAIRSPCKCPVCDYISTRHWNVKSHIKKKHGNVGEPMRVYGRRQLALGPEQDLAYLSDWRHKIHFMIPNLLKINFLTCVTPGKWCWLRKSKRLSLNF